MARYNEGLAIAFNDNDGGATYLILPACYDDFQRHYKCLGKWKARWFFFKKFWLALMRIEENIDTKKGSKIHKFKV